jgi:hypothetical protein
MVLPRTPGAPMLTPMQHGGVRFTPPPEFTLDQTLVSMRAPPPTAGDPRVLHKQTAIRPSFLVHRRDVGDTPLEVLAGEVTAELVSSIAGLSALTTESFTYDDNVDGMIVGFDFAAESVGTARQYHALRKDGRVLTTATLTVDGLSLNDVTKAKWLALLSSVVLDGDGGLR